MSNGVRIGSWVKPKRGAVPTETEGLRGRVVGEGVSGETWMVRWEENPNLVRAAWLVGFWHKSKIVSAARPAEEEAAYYAAVTGDA